jgi:hypothetical protein
LSLEALNCLSSLYVIYCIHHVFHGSHQIWILFTFFYLYCCKDVLLQLPE